MEKIKNSKADFVKNASLTRESYLTSPSKTTLEIFAHDTLSRKFLGKNIVTVILSIILLVDITGLSYAITPISTVANTTKPVVYKKNARTINYAFVFDGPSTKNNEVLNHFKTSIIKTTAPDYKAGFSANNVFVGNWTDTTVRQACEKAMASNATMVVSLGYLSSKYLKAKQNKNKFVVTIDQYGLRDIGGDFFNPVQQSISGIKFFKRLVKFQKAAILMNDTYYKTRKDWDTVLKTKMPDISFDVIPVNNSNINSVTSKISTNYDVVVLTPLFNISSENKQKLINAINAHKMPSFSTLGKDDVKDGVLVGAGAYDLDRKIAEATSFNIIGTLNGNKTKPQQIMFYENEVVYLNMDTAKAIGYDPHLRILNNAEIISNEPVAKYSLSDVFSTMYAQNIDIERKKLLVKAARKASLAAMLKYLPTFGITLGYQSYDDSYADSVKLSMPEKTGVFKMGVEQIIYSPALVTNILVKKKMVDFQKQEAFMTEQNMGIELAMLYLEELMLENMVQVQKENVVESRENLAIARVREKMGKCGSEEALRWSTQLFEEDQQFLDMRADLKNVRIGINKILNKEQTERFRLNPLKANDPAFYTSEINIIDYVSTPNNLEKFTKMLIAEAYRVAPELAKLKAAKKMKTYEKNMYYQKFILPDAKLNLEYTSLMNRQFTGDTILPAQSVYAAKANAMASKMGGAPTSVSPTLLPKPEATNMYFGIFAQWKPIEGGTKIAEIARLNAELKELERYEDEAKTEIEQRVRSTINKALAGYFSLEKDYKGMYAAEENYKRVQALYLKGNTSLEQMMDAQRTYKIAKVKAMNAQNVFFKELIWVQRSICAIDWTKATPEAKDFIKKVKTELEVNKDFEYL